MFLYCFETSLLALLGFCFIVCVCVSVTFLNNKSKKYLRLITNAYMATLQNKLTVNPTVQANENVCVLLTLLKILCKKVEKSSF